MSIIQQMTQSKNLTPSEEQIIHFIMENSDEIIHLSISQLAKRTYSSNAAIIRLCRKLGTDGFRDFKLKYAQELEKQRQERVNIDINFPFHKHENTQDISYDIAALTKAAVDICYQEISSHSLKEVASLIFESRHVLVYANGDSLIRAMSFENKLLKIGRHLTITSQRSEEISYSAWSDAKDCALFLTYSASDPKLLKNAQILKSHGTSIITITACPDTPLGHISDYLVTIPNLEDNINSIATFYSQISFEYVLNVIYSIIYTIHYEENRKQKQALDQVRVKTKTSSNFQ